MVCKSLLWEKLIVSSAPFEVIYGYVSRWLLCWLDLGKRCWIKCSIVHGTADKIVMIREKLKDYSWWTKVDVDRRRELLDFKLVVKVLWMCCHERTLYVLVEWTRGVLSILNCMSSAKSESFAYNLELPLTCYYFWCVLKFNYEFVLCCYTLSCFLVYAPSIVLSICVFRVFLSN